MKITILGSGTGLPSPTRGSPGVLVQAGGRTLLWDSGPGTLQNLARAGIRMEQLDFLCYTHYHPDHTLDLLAFLFASKNPLARRREEPFEIVAPQGFEEWYANARRLYGSWVEPPAGTWRIHQWPGEGGERRIDPDVRLKAIPVEHTPRSMGYRLESGDGVVAYSGDADVCDGLVELGRNADLFILECSMPDGRKVEGHLTPSLAGEIAHRAGARKVVLTHFYPPCDEVDVAAQCRNHFSGEIAAATDGMVIEV